MDTNMEDQPTTIKAIKVTDTNQLTIETISSYEDYPKHLEGMIEAVRLIVPSIIPSTNVYNPVDRNNPETYRGNTQFTMWVNDSYLLYPEFFNRWNYTAVGVAISAGRIDLIGQGVLGNVLFTGDADEEGETLSLPSDAAEFIAAVHQMAKEELFEFTDNAILNRNNNGGIS